MPNIRKVHYQESCEYISNVMFIRNYSCPVKKSQLPSVHGVIQSPQQQIVDIKPWKKFQ